MNYRKFLYLYSRNGTSAIFNTFFSKLGFKHRFKNAIDYRVNWITKEIKKFTKNIVYSGLYKGMKIHEEFFWVGKDISTKLLGLYELEVQNNIKKIQAMKKKNIELAEAREREREEIQKLKNELIKEELKRKLEIIKEKK